MTGSQILAGFASIGAVVQLTPAGVVNVESPDVPGLERLVSEVKANRSEVVEELKRHAAPFTAPGRGPEHPCLLCGRGCPEGVLFETDTCFTAWKLDRAARRATSPRDGRRGTGATSAIPPEATGPRGTA